MSAVPTNHATPAAHRGLERVIRLQQDLLEDIALDGGHREILEKIRTHVDAAYPGAALSYLFFNRLIGELTTCVNVEGHDQGVANEQAASVAGPPTVCHSASSDCWDHMWRWFRANAGPGLMWLPIRDGMGSVTGVVFLETPENASDARECRRMLRICAHSLEVFVRRAEQNDAIYQFANRDPLTGLANRALFNRELERTIENAKRRGERFALLFMDLDRFKQINDTHGHETGDELLRQFARRADRAIVNSHVLARLGGDEFVAIITCNGAASSIGRVAGNLLESLRGAYRTGRAVLEVKASVGVAVYPDDADSATELLRAADNALFAAKREGRGRYRLAADEPLSAPSPGVSEHRGRRYRSRHRAASGEADKGATTGSCHGVGGRGDAELALCARMFQERYTVRQERLAVPDREPAR